MDSLMIIVPVEIEIWPHAHIICNDPSVPYDIREAIELYVSRKEPTMYEESCIKKIEFEVEVWYREKDGLRVPVNAKIQTLDVPSFVAAWVELEAMKQVGKREVVR